MSRQPDEERLTAMILDSIRTQGRAIAAMMGPAPGAEDVTGQRELAMWTFRDPGVDPLKALVDFIADQGMDPETAAVEATKRTYPYREAMVQAVGSDEDPKPRVEYARRLNREASRAGLESWKQPEEPQTAPVPAAAANPLPAPTGPPPAALGGLADRYAAGAA